MLPTSSELHTSWLRLYGNGNADGQIKSTTFPSPSRCQPGVDVVGDGASSDCLVKSISGIRSSLGLFHTTSNSRQNAPASQFCVFPNTAARVKTLDQNNAAVS